MQEPDNYNTSKIRSFLERYFDDGDIVSLCFDNFREVYDAFGTLWSKPQRIQQLLGFCRNHDEFDRLLMLLRQERPKPYRLFFGDLKTEIRFLLPAVQLDEVTAQQLSDLTAGFLCSLAITIGVPAEQLEVVSITPSNSAVITIRLPLIDSLNATRLDRQAKARLGIPVNSELTLESWGKFLWKLPVDSEELKEILSMLLPDELAKITEGFMPKAEPTLATLLERIARLPGIQEQQEEFLAVTDESLARIERTLQLPAASLKRSVASTGLDAVGDIRLLRAIRAADRIMG